MLIPNISLLLTFAGAVLGTIVNVILPVMFYNRAYNGSEKNLKMQKRDGSNPEEENLLNKEDTPAEERDQ